MATTTANETLRASSPGIDWRLLWSGGEELSLAKMLGLGALVWAVYSLVQLWVNGIILDETVMPAQIIAGAVHYPLGHPHQVFYPKVFSGMNYLAAALWKVVPSALFLSAIRDFLFVFSSAFSSFAVALLLTRRPLWGHLAATVALTETGVRLWGNYPMWIFPDGYSHGHLGLQAAVLIPVLLLAGCWGTGGFLLGVLPTLHFSMVTVVWPWSLCFLSFSSARPRGVDRKRLIAGLCAGLTLCAILGFVIFARTKGTTVDFPYKVAPDGGLVYKNFTALTDYHRRPFTFLSLGYLVSLLAFIALGGVLLKPPKNATTENHRTLCRRCLVWLLLLGGFAWGVVFGTRVLQMLAGSLPQYLQIAMPYRLSNIPVLLLIPLTVAAFSAVLKDMGSDVREIGFALLALVAVGTGLLLALEPGPFRWPYRTWVASHLIFVIWGVLFAFDLFAHRRRRNRLLLSLVAPAALAVSMFLLYRQTRAGVFFLTGFVVTLALLSICSWLLQPRGNWAFTHRWSSLVLLCGCVLTVAAALPGRRVNLIDSNAPNHERPYLLYPYDRELSAWLSKNTSPNEMILAPLNPPTGLQAKTGHPVLMEWETLYLLTYMPNLAPTIGGMMRDLFGIDYSGPEAARSIARHERINPEIAWQNSWKNRKLAEWQLLSRKYSFRLVVSMTSLPLNLPVALPGKTWTLYTIPATELEAEPSRSASPKSSVNTATVQSIQPVSGRSVLQSR